MLDSEIEGIIEACGLSKDIIYAVEDVMDAERFSTDINNIHNAWQKLAIVIDDEQIR
jgi:hypothetical protein